MECAWNFIKREQQQKMMIDRFYSFDFRRIETWLLICASHLSFIMWFVVHNVVSYKLLEHPHRAIRIDSNILLALAFRRIGIKLNSSALLLWVNQSTMPRALFFISLIFFSRVSVVKLLLCILCILELIQHANTLRYTQTILRKRYALFQERNKNQTIKN